MRILPVHWFFLVFKPDLKLDAGIFIIFLSGQLKVSANYFKKGTFCFRMLNEDLISAYSLQRPKCWMRSKELLQSLKVKYSMWVLHHLRNNKFVSAFVLRNLSHRIEARNLK